MGLAGKDGKKRGPLDTVIYAIWIAAAVVLVIELAKAANK